MLKAVVRKDERRKVFQTSKQCSKRNHWLQFGTSVKDEKFASCF